MILLMKYVSVMASFFAIQADIGLGCRMQLRFPKATNGSAIRIVY